MNKSRFEKGTSTADAIKYKELLDITKNLDKVEGINWFPDTYSISRLNQQDINNTDT